MEYDWEQDAQGSWRTAIGAEREKVLMQISNLIFSLSNRSRQNRRLSMFDQMPAIPAASRAAAITPFPVAGAARAIGGDA